MIFSTILQSAATRFSHVSDTPMLDARIIVSYSLNVSIEYLFTHDGEEVPCNVLSDIEQNIQKREQGMPVAYITNKKEFFGRSFFVDESVLIPRPDTEVLVEYALQIIRQDITYSSPHILDMGTGSGAIAITLKKEYQSAQVYASDISEKALIIAQKNAKSLEADITFLESDLLQSVPLEVGMLDIIVANLPYVADSVQEPSIQFEPKHALYSGVDGLNHYRRLAKQLAVSSATRRLIIEIDDAQAESAPSLFPFAKKYTLIHDLAGKRRGVDIEL